MKDQAGFTLLEILVVMALLACVVLAVSLVGHSLVDRVRLSYAASTVIARIHRAEAEADANGVVVSVRPRDLSQGLPAAVHIGAGRDDTQPDLLFYPDGSASMAPIVLSAGRLRRNLTVEALTGRVDDVSN